MCLVRPLRQGVLIAVADGVGHGPEAVEAARRALGAATRDWRGPGAWP